jgi:hypothetical protein
MSIAVLVCGEYREFDIAVKSWSFLNDLNCDVYFSTWNKSIQVCEGLNIYLDEDVTEERILSHIPTATVSVLNEYDHFPKIEGFDPQINTNKMIFHWKKCLEMVRNSGKQYDQIMIMRPDNYQTSKITNIDKFYSYREKDRVYGQQFINITGVKRYFVTDLYFIGDYEVMSNVIDKIDSTRELRETNIQSKLGILFVSLNLYVARTDEFDVVVLRPNVRPLAHVLNPVLVLDRLRMWDSKKIRS